MPPPLGPRISSASVDPPTPATGIDDTSNRESPSIVLLPIEETYNSSECSVEKAAADNSNWPETRTGTKTETDAGTGTGTASNAFAGAGRPRGASMHRRPKSLYEKPSFKMLPIVAPTDEILLPSRASSSMASAKAFLTMIASSTAASGRPHRTLESAGLTIATTGSRSSFRQHSFCDLAMSPSPSPSSAPISGPSSTFAGIQTVERSRTSTALSAQEPEKAEALQRGTVLMEKSDSQASSPGSRSLRMRSRLAGVGIRRASTYVWSRSSVFMRSLSSADDLPESPLQQKAHEHSLHDQPHQPHQPHPTDAINKTADAQSTFPEPLLVPMQGTGSDALMPNDPDVASPAQTPETPSVASAAGSSPAPVAATTSIPTLVASKKSPAVMRLHAARELVMTEKNFVDNLFVIKK
ncbi:hypothetical protein J3B02_004992, partial [Coemansia erecta]